MVGGRVKGFFGASHPGAGALLAGLQGIEQRERRIVKGRPAGVTFLEQCRLVNLGERNRPDVSN